MKTRKTVKSIAAAALALVLAAAPAGVMDQAAFNVSAADWSKADVDGGRVISANSGEIVYTADEDAMTPLLSINVSDILANADDISKVRTAVYLVGYEGLSSLTGTDISYIGGGCYFSGSSDFSSFAFISDGYADDGTAVWSDKYDVNTITLTSPLTADSKLYIVDWSGIPMASNNISIRIYGLALFDEEENMLEQKSYTTPATTPVVSAGKITYTGDYYGSGVTVTGSGVAGAEMSIDVPAGYSADIISGNIRVASFCDTKGKFTMPSGDITVNVTCYMAGFSVGYKNAYIYSYDKNMNHIKTNSVRGVMKNPQGEVTVKLGADYAGKSVTLYSGKKSTVGKLEEAVLDSNGRAVFTVKSGKNYTLIVED